MLYHNKCDISVGTDSIKIYRSKDSWYATIGFYIMDSNFKILYAMFAMIWQFCVLI